MQGVDAIDKVSVVKVFVKFNEDNDLDLGHFDANKYTVADIKLRVRAARPSIRNPALHELRLISQGRVVANSSLLSELLLPHYLQRKVQDRDGSAAKSKGKQKQRSLEPLTHCSSSSIELENQQIPTIFFHCAVTERSLEKQKAYLSSSASWVQENEGTTFGAVSDGSGLPTRNGFDRLLDIGFSTSDVSVIREQFHAIRGSGQTQGQDAMIAEENWMDSRAHNPSSASLNDSDSNNESGSDDSESQADTGNLGLDPEAAISGGQYHMLMGVLVGFFFNVLALFCFLEPNLFSRKAQLGIATGFLVNIIWGTVRLIF